jgi:hypothetical protein
MSFLSLFTDAFSGANVANATNETKEALGLMMDLARSKADLFERTIADYIRTAGTPENATAPIETVVASQSEIYAMKKSDASSITDTVQSVVNVVTSDADENKSKNISSMVGKVVGGILGEASGKETEKRKYIVFTEGLSIVRLDMHVWTKDIKASGLFKTEQERVVVLTLFKSTIDISKLKLNTFLSLYQNQLSGDATTTPTQVLKRLEEAKQVYAFFHD